jgi:hypothetical protein
MSDDDEVKPAEEEEEEKESGSVSPELLEDGLPEVEDPEEIAGEEDVVSLDKLREEEEEEDDLDYDPDEW